MSSATLRTRSVEKWVTGRLLTLGVLLCCVLALGRANQLALLTGTLRTFQKYSCDHETLVLECPEDTKLDVLFAQYLLERVPGDLTCPGQWNSRLAFAVHDGAATCHLPEEVNYKTLQEVVSKCQEKSRCVVPVAPKTFGLEKDPCPDIRKYIEVAFKCRPDKFIQSVVCEGQGIDLSCDPFSRIAIFSVLFGRSIEGSHNCPQPKGLPEEDCRASFATEMVMNACHGKRKCHIDADPHVFGRPCSPEALLYMKTAYTCVPLKVLKSKFANKADEYEDELNDIERPPPEGPSGPPAYASPGDVKSDSKAATAPEGTPSSSTNNPFYNPTIKAPLDGDAKYRVTQQDQHLDEDARQKPDIINCTITIIQGSKEPQIGFLAEWMRAISFIQRNFEKFILYLILGLCAGILSFLVVLVSRLLLERRRTAQQVKMMHDPLASVFATGGIDDIDEDLDLSPPPVRSSSLAGSPNGRDPLSPHEVVRYHTVARTGLRRQDSDVNPPRSLSANNDNQFLYS